MTLVQHTFPPLIGTISLLVLQRFTTSPTDSPFNMELK